MAKNLPLQSTRLFGFDTFEGLPENWGAFDKGSMAYDLPDISDNRAEFIKGLFQNTLEKFIEDKRELLKKRLIIHLDADLFSATLYSLFMLKPFLKKGDILMFDEFNVPNHEFYAFRLFCESGYLKVKLIAAVNNYYQAAFIIQ
ncbi:MAG: TylF/MycF/NovP-related O-methyltransferase [Saprospiraceae bacterium]